MPVNGLLNRLCSETSDNLIKVASVIWGVWWARNKCVWDGQKMSPAIAMHWSSKQITNWRQAQDKRKAARNQLERDRNAYTTRWSVPNHGELKLNVDASVLDGANFFSVGMVLRDHHGTFVKGRVLKIAGKVEVIEAELIGILEALQWIKDIQGYSVIIENDSLLSVQAINGKSINLLEAGIFIEQAREFISSRNWIKLGFVKKQANKVAHLMARLPCMLNGFIDLLSPPSCMLETLVSDI